MRRVKAPLRAALVLLLCLACLTGDLVPFSMLEPARAVTQADIDAKKKEAAALASQKKDLQSQISELAKDKSSALRQKELLDRQIAVIEDEIYTLESSIRDYEQLIAENECELREKQAEEEARYDLFCARVRAMEENGQISYWATLFKANSFTDLLSRLDMINEIMESDQRIMENLREIQAEIRTEQAELNAQKQDLEVQRSELEARGTELEQQRRAATELIGKIQANEKENAALLAEMKRQEEAVEKEIEALMAQYAAERFSGGEGEFIWPVSSRYITSLFGYRAASVTNYVGTTNHKGVDVGRVYFTSEVHAAKSGKVTTSTYNSSYGNYVTINHGDGTQTLYAHLSSCKVKSGATVKQGQLIGITGSTGHSTGAHLHYEIWKNGSRVNPLDYYDTSIFTFSPSLGVK